MKSKIADKNEQNQSATIKRITFIGLLANICLAIIKLFSGILGHSNALVADAIHSFSDISTDLAVLWGVKLWMRPADRNHPYGHRKIELLITIVISLLIFLAGWAIFLRSYSLLKIKTYYIQPSWVAFWVALFSLVVKEVLYQWTVKKGKQLKASALIANAWHHRSDAFSSLPVALAIALAIYRPNLKYLDLIAAVIVSIFIIFTAIKIFYECLQEIMDRGIPIAIQQRIESFIKDIQGIKSIHALRTRKIGLRWFLDLHIQVDPYITVKEGHDIAEAVEKKVIEKFPEILDVLVHIEPYYEK